MNGLVAEASGPTATAGGRIFDSVNSVSGDLGNVGTGEFDAISLTVNGVVAGLDVLAFAANPFKELMMAGVGFIIEHVDFLREPLDWLAGDPAEITALSQTWTNIAGQLAEASEAFATELEGLTGWDDEVSEAYRETAAAYQASLAKAAEWSQETSRGVAVAGVVAVLAPSARVRPGVTGVWIAGRARRRSG